MTTTILFLSESVDHWYMHIYTEGQSHTQESIYSRENGKIGT